MTCGSHVEFKNQDIGYPESCSSCRRKKAYETNGFIPWNRGLSRDTDERIALAATNMHKHYVEVGHHSTGKTKKSDAGVAIKASKISAGLNRHYETHDGWSLGMTKETSDMIAARGKKIGETLKNRKHVVLSDETLEKMRRAKLLTLDTIQNRLNERGLELLGDYVDTVTKANIRCIGCNNMFIRHLGAVFNNNARCQICFPPWAEKTSAWQKDIYNFVRSLTPDVELNNRSMLGDNNELDIYVPAHRLGIECNGLYWHSESSGRFQPSHTEEKRLLAIKAGISLITIFEDEWRDKRSIVKSMIMHRLNMSTPIGARKLTINRCKPTDVAGLLNEWHLEGSVGSSFALTLTDDDHGVIGACTIRWARGVTRTLEIARIAFLPTVHVNGGVSKFINEAKQICIENDVTRLISYSDNRLGTGSAYRLSGMQFVKITIPRFWWTDHNKRYNRLKYKANKRKNISEKQAASDAGVSKIYGCSNSLWSLTLTC